MKLRFLRILSLGFLPLVAACSSEAGEDVDTTEDDLSLPSFVSMKTTDLGCGDVAREKFAGADSAHGYKVDAKKGRAYHFEFAGLLQGNHRTSLALFDAKTKRRIKVSRGAERVALDFEPTADKEYIVAAYTSRRFATGDYKLKEFCAIPEQNLLAEGQTSFENEEREQPMFFRGAAENARSPVADRAPSGRSQAVEEADVYKVSGTKLFYLNTYRGFLVFDVANPKAPKQMGRLPVYGHPVEMYVQNDVVYALMNDVLELRDVEGRLRFEKKRTAQLVAIDISNPAQPKVLETVDIAGSLREGLSRKVGDTIYVVTQEYAYSWIGNEEQSKEQAWVYSFNAANPKDVKLVQKLKVFEGGGGNTSSQGASAGRHFNGVTISATSNALLVAENWQTYSSVWGSGYSCGSSTSLQEANVSIVDISNPSGQIRVHAKLTTYGHVGDQFKQTYMTDPVTGKATYLGVFARQEWQTQNCQGQSRIENALEAWDVTNGASPTKLAKLTFGKPNETVRGTAFDTERGVLYSITAERVDPLYAISFKNPSQLKVLSEVDGLSGDMNLFRFIGDKKFLLAVGTDNSNECQGFNSPATGFTSKVHASIIDVQDTSKIRLVQRKCITVNDAQWMGSQVNWNLDQAHKMIGLHESGLVNLVSVPVHYTKKVAVPGGWDSYKSETAVGLLSWNLGNYDATKPADQQNVLENASTIVHPAGEVKRTVVWTHPGAVARRKLLNLSNTHLGIVDIENPKAPSTDAVVEIAPYKDRAIAFGGFVVEQIQPTTDWGWMQDGVTEFRVKAMGPKVDDAPVLATFTAPSVERAVRFGNALVLFTRKTTNLNGNTSTELFATIYDLATPTAPRKAGTIKLPVEYLAYPRFAAGSSSYFFPYWGDAQDMVESDKGLVFLTSTWSPGGQQARKLVGLNLSNVDAPKVVSVSLSSAADTTMLGLAKDENAAGDAGAIWLSYKKKTGTVDRDGTAFDKVKYSAQRFTWSWTGANIWPGATVNLPGKLVRTFVQDGKRVMLAHDRTFDILKAGGFAESPRLALLTLSTWGSTATLEDSARLWGMDLRDLVLDGGRLYTNLAERQRGFGIMPFDVARGPIRWTPPASELRIFTVSSEKIAERFAEDLGSDGIDLMGVHDKRLFVNLAGDGVLVVDAADASRPFARSFVRTLGWSWSVEPAGADALIAAGHYGIYQVPLY